MNSVQAWSPLSLLLFASHVMCDDVLGVEKTAEKVADEGYINTIDALLLGALIAAVAWYYFKGREENDDALPPANIHIR